MLDTERAYYSDHVDAWTKEHAGQFVVVKQQELVGFFTTADDALAAGAARFGMESFLVRQVGAHEEDIRLPALTLGLIGAHR